LPAMIGFPMTLTYFFHFPMWKIFFTELGFEFVTSPPTNKVILDKGIKETVTDACVPIKLFHGHAAALKNKVDYIFIPRMVNIDRGKHITFCPKFLGLPDMLRASIANLPPILEVRLDRKKGRLYLFKACKHIGDQFGKSFFEILKAYRKAIEVQKKFEKMLITKKITPTEGIDLLFKKSCEKRNEKYDLNIAVVGYPYQIYDTYISANVINKLREKNVRVWTMEMIPYSTLKKYASKLKKKLFWHFSNKVVWACYHYIKQPFIDGIVHVTAFGCGPDAMVDKLIELECKQHNFPFLNLTIDEHTGEGGVETRIEAFVDMIKFRRVSR